MRSLAVVAALLAAALVLGGCAAGVAGTASRSPGSEPTGAAAGAPPSGVPVVQLSDLPPQAAEVAALIEAGGPFPYRQDGVTFGNRERLLPNRPTDYYHEYTVPTPGSQDRGARRIITGAGGEMYWTDDHYDSFAWIAR